MLYKAHNPTCHRFRLPLNRVATTRKFLHSTAATTTITTTECTQSNTSSSHPQNQQPRCKCHKSLLPLCAVIPRQTFGNSIFTGPSIALLRLVFKAASFRLHCRHNKRVRNKTSGQSMTASERFSETVLKPRRLAREKLMKGKLFANLARKVSTQSFLAEVTNSQGIYANYQVVSISWVKALASHMSHEFIQFIIEDSNTGHRLRLITDRQETGDWVIITTEPPGVESLQPATRSFSWPKFSPYQDRHDLPLPLVSLRLNDEAARPRLVDMARMLVEISEGSPQYSPLRHHCWWYAEAVFDGVRERYGGELHEWPWAKYRYSFVLCNGWVRRETLAAQARDFEVGCMNEMTY